MSTASLARALKQARLVSGLSQKQLARRMDVNHSYISHLENDGREPSIKFLRRFVSVVEVPAGFFIALLLWQDLDKDERAEIRPLIERQLADSFLGDVEAA